MYLCPHTQHKLKQTLLDKTKPTSWNKCHVLTKMQVGSKDKGLRLGLCKLESTFPSLCHMTAIQTSICPSRCRCPTSPAHGISCDKGNSALHEPVGVSGSENSSARMRWVAIKVLIPKNKPVVPSIAPDALIFGFGVSNSHSSPQKAIMFLPRERGSPLNACRYRRNVFSSVMDMIRDKTDSR